jgi:hypothetical protein
MCKRHKHRWLAVRIDSEWIWEKCRDCGAERQTPSTWRNVTKKVALPALENSADTEAQRQAAAMLKPHSARAVVIADLTEKIKRLRRQIARHPPDEKNLRAQKRKLEQERTEHIARRLLDE